jgi:hypothetical protein
LVDSSIYDTGADIKDVKLVGVNWQLPTAISDLSAVPDTGEVHLTWSDPLYAAGYKVYYGTTSGTYSNSIDVGAVKSYTVTGLTNDVKYFFAVRG